MTLNYPFHQQEAVYNQTINIVEVSEGLDGETFFLYIFLGAACVLGLVLGQQALSSLARRRSPRSQSKPLETGTANNVDYDWLPKEVVNQLSEYFVSLLSKWFYISKFATVANVHCWRSQRNCSPVELLQWRWIGCFSFHTSYSRFSLSVV